MATYQIYTTTEQVRQEIASKTDRREQEIRTLCVAASGGWTRLCRGRFFVPVRQRRYYDYTHSGILKLDEDLVAVETLYTDNGSTTISNYFLKSGEDYNFSPYDKIVLNESTGDTLTYSTTPQRSQSVDGWWCYHEDYANSAWEASGATVTTDSGTSLTVSDANAAGLLGLASPLRVFQYVRLSDGTNYEIALITEVNRETNVLTLIRGINGTSAVTATGSVEVYRVEPEVARIVARLAAFIARSQQSSRADLDRPVFTDQGVIMPARLPADIIEAAKKYRKEEI